MHPLEVSAGERADPAAGAGGTGERDQPDERMRRPAPRRRRRRPGSTDSTPSGSPASSKTRTIDTPPADRRPRIRLEHHGVAERQRGRDRTDGQDLREVERRDHADDTDRHSLRPSSAVAPRSAAARRTAATGRLAASYTPATRCVSNSAVGGRTRLSRMIQDSMSAAFAPDRRGATQHRGPLRMRPGGPVGLRGGGDARPRARRHRPSAMPMRPISAPVAGSRRRRRRRRRCVQPSR